MKVNFQNKNILAVACLAIVLAASVIFISVPKENKEITPDQNYILLTGFKPNTQIEVLIDNKQSKSLIISQKSEEKFSNFEFKNYIQYNINENNNFVDLSILRNNNTNLLTAKLSGLEKGNAANFSNDNEKTFIPVDWSGKIELSNPVNQNPICLNIKTDDVKTICHFFKDEVTS